MTQVKLIILEDSTNISGPPRSNVSGSENIVKDSLTFLKQQVVPLTSKYVSCEMWGVVETWHS
jgi:hypothetical protein